MSVEGFGTAVALIDGSFADITRISECQIGWPYFFRETAVETDLLGQFPRRTFSTRYLEGISADSASNNKTPAS